MAKKSKIAEERKRRAFVERYAERRAELKERVDGGHQVQLVTMAG